MTAVANQKSPICHFYRLIPGAPDPRRADRSAEGTLPVNAYRYCEPIASASGFGWYLYPPLNFSLMLDGNEIIWTYEGADGWFALRRAAQYPDFVKTFAGMAPREWVSRRPSLRKDCCLEPSRFGADIWRERNRDGRCCPAALPT